MKKLILICLVCLTGFAQAQIDNLSNLSAEWMRTGARNAAKNGTDIAVYNPAGLTHLESGLHVNISNQSLFRNPSHSYDLGFGDGMKNFSQSGSDPFLPALYLSYNKNKWAFMGGLYMSGGGATLNYPNGSITTDMIALQVVQAAGGAYMSASNQSLKASSMYMTTMAGAAYSVSKNISFSLALRNVNATNKTEGGMTLTLSPFDLPDQPMVINYDERANGMGFTVGFNIDCNDKFNIAGRYESKVELDFETEQIKDDFGMTTDGQMNRRDLPAVLALGFSLKAGEKITAYGDFNYYFQKGADWGKSTMLTNEESYSSLAGNAYSISAGFEYAFSPKITGSFGGGFTNYLFENRDAYYTKAGTFEVMHDDNTNINAGMRVQASKRVALNVGYMHTFWSSEQDIKALMLQPMDVNVKVNNSLNAVAVGVELAF